MKLQTLVTFEQIILSAIVVIALCKFATGIPASGIIQISTSYSASSTKDYNVTYCNPTIPNTSNGRVHSIVANGNCFNIYHQENCTGPYIRYVPGRMERLYGPSRHKWEDGNLVKEDLLVKSIGPCFDKCDSRNWEGATDPSVLITLYDDENFEGNATTLIVQGDECILVPPPRKLWESLQISGNESNSCVELHSDSSCGWEFTQFRPGYPHLHDMWYWGLGEDHYALNTVAVSMCGKYCNKTIPQVKPAPEKTPGKNVVTVYDFFGYYGNSANINLTNGCVTLNETQLLVSIRTYDQCVILYAQRDCQNKAGSYTLQTSGMPKDYYTERLLSLTTPVRPKSLQLCSTNNAIARETSTSNSNGETKMNASPFDQIDTPKSFAVWTIVFLVFGGLILFVFGAVVGAYFSQYYEKVCYGVNAERFNVVYKLQT